MRQIKSLNSVKIISIDFKSLFAELQNIAAKLVEQFEEVEGIFLIGSMARGDYTGFSDVDVLLILSGSSRNPVERIRKYLPHFDLPIGVDLLVYTESEYDEMLEQGGPLAERISGERISLT